MDRILDPAPRRRPVPTNFAVMPPPQKTGFVSARAARRAYRNAIRLEMKDRLPDLVIGAVIGGGLVAVILLVLMPFVANLTSTGGF